MAQCRGQIEKREIGYVRKNFCRKRSKFFKRSGDGSSSRASHPDMFPANLPRKSKLMDDGDDDVVDLFKVMKPSVSWQTPAMLPDRSEVTKPLLESVEVTLQNERMKTVPLSIYASESDVPENPVQLTDSELQLEAATQKSSAVADIPFFVPQIAPVPVPVPAPVSAPAPVPMLIPATTYTESVSQSYAPTSTYALTPQFDTAATAEFVQSLGLPMCKRNV
jgi:hypothetical protein